MGSADNSDTPATDQAARAAQSPTGNHKERIAGGAGLAFVGRLGALIEVGSMIAFTWLYGAATFGLFAALWAYVKVSTTVSDIAMTTALQRFVPRADANDANLVAGFALKISFLIGTIFALTATLLAPELAPFINASDTDAARLVAVIQIYVWVLPFWTLVEVATAAVRARRAFGPEIKIRIFYEQGLRLVTATGFAFAGLLTYGLFLAHLLSVMMAAALALRLIAKHYDLRLVLKAPLTGTIASDMRTYGLSVMPANISKRLFSEFPVIILNLILPGAAGAAASGFYAVARKVASALQVVRLAFEYVMAPLAAERDGHGDHKALEEMFAYATRLSICIALPFGAALILARHDILAAMKPEFQIAAAAIAILVAGRVLEAATGPSTAIIEMLGHRLLPAFNGLVGFAVLAYFSVKLIPMPEPWGGVTGAAIAAAVGLNVTALLSLIQAGLLYKLVPFSSYLWRPLVISLLLAGAILALIPASATWAAPTGLFTALALLLAALSLLIRFGLSVHDAKALGKIGRFLKK